MFHVAKHDPSGTREQETRLELNAAQCAHGIIRMARDPISRRSRDVNEAIINTPDPAMRETPDQRGPLPELKD